MHQKPIQYLKARLISGQHISFFYEQSSRRQQASKRWLYESASRRSPTYPKSIHKCQHATISSSLYQDPPKLKLLPLNRECGPRPVKHNTNIKSLGQNALTQTPVSTGPGLELLLPARISLRTNSQRGSVRCSLTSKSDFSARMTLNGGWKA